MFFRDLIPYTKLDSFKEELLKQRNIINVGIFAWIIGMLLMCIIFMSLMIVKVSSTAEFYQNQTAALRTRNIQSYSDHSGPADTTLPTVVQIGGQEQSSELSTTDFVQMPTHPLRTPSYNKSARMDEMRVRVQQQLLQQQQQQQELYEQQQIAQQQHEVQHYQQHQPTLEQVQKVEARAGDETAYLLERADSAGAPLYEQPIYGTWRTKARRPQPPPPQIVDDSADAGATGAAKELQQRLEHQLPQLHQRIHEKPLRRGSTMMPARSELHDQIPRPPRLTSRQPSMVLRRQYLEIPINASFMDEEKPKPFHFPQDGPLPHEFKKTEEERGAGSVAEVNNIQDILQQLQLGGGPSRVPSLVMMPTGLHIAGSFKNLKSSGITNFFRGKRNKKQMQLSFPLPLPMQLLKPYPVPVFNVLGQPYQQRISMDHIYPFKPRSPNEVNLLAMQHQQQQQQQQKFKSQRSKNNKRKNKKPNNTNIAVNANPIANSNLLLQQYSHQRPYAADPYMMHYPYQQTQLLDTTVAAQKTKAKRVPFKVNLDIFPVLPPTKDYKASAAYTYDDLMLPSTTRAPASNLPRNPFLDYYSFPFVSSTPVYGAVDQHSYAPFRFPTSPQSHSVTSQSSNTQIMFPDQVHKPLYVMPVGNQQTPFMPLDVAHGSSNAAAAAAEVGKSKQNQIMVHLNVFPKKKPQPLPPPTNNPFYNNAYNINRHIANEDATSLIGIEPRQQPPRNNSSTTTSPEQTVSRSDSSDPEAFVDFNHPIVAEDVSTFDQPHAEALVSNKLEAPEHASHYDHIEMRNRSNNNFRYNDTNVDQLASEAQTASLFRFPVEDLIKFQVDDAL